MKKDDLRVFVGADEILGKVEITLRRLRDNDDTTEKEHAQVLRMLKETAEYRNKLNRLSGEMFLKDSDSIYDTWTQQIGKDKR